MSNENTTRTKENAAGREASALSAALAAAQEADNKLMRLRNRILRAGQRGTGCYITAEEARLLKVYELPCTSEHECIRNF